MELVINRLTTLGLSSSNSCFRGFPSLLILSLLPAADADLAFSLKCLAFELALRISHLYLSTPLLSIGLFPLTFTL